MDEALRVAVVALRELADYTAGESPEPEDVVIMREHARSALARIEPGPRAEAARLATKEATVLDDERLIDRRLLAVGIGLAVLNVLLWAGLVIGLFFAFKAIF